MIVEEKAAIGKDCCRDRKIPCGGSRCMAWRWATEDNPEWVPPHMMLQVDTRKNDMFIRSKTHGYCGLAGGA